METWLVVLLIGGGLLALLLLMFLGILAIKGAVALFAMAVDQGFVGIAAYIACWVLLAPAMLVACIIAGLWLFLAGH